MVGPHNAPSFADSPHDGSPPRGKPSRADKVLLWSSMVIIPVLGIIISSVVAILTNTKDDCSALLGICKPPPAQASPTPSAQTSQTPTTQASQTASPRVAPSLRAQGKQPPIWASESSNRNYGPYFIVNRKTEKCVDLDGLGPAKVDEQLQQFGCNGREVDNQEWRFEPKGSDEAGYQLYWIKNPDGGSCIDPPERAGVAPGTGLRHTWCAESDNQYFRLEQSTTSNGITYYWLRNAVSNLCVEAPDGGNGVQLTLSECRPDNGHQWALLSHDELLNSGYSSN
ncbi:RICIN domain-containing protein [Micromonospora haikouensis]|uniref:RICIN domain-containing protein n=1 Tax=Micromonospora haikouensis TaxID=686309 RepID=UPI00379C77E2